MYTFHNSREELMNLGDMRVVVIDDSQLSLDLIDGMARRIGMKTALFLSPLEALDYIKNNPVDMVFTDFVMPGMDGVMLVREIRRIHSYIPIIMITAVDDNASLRLKALESGATDFLTKPFNVPEFTARAVNLASLRTFQVMQKARGDRLEDEVEKATGEILKREHETLLILGKAAEFRDHETGNHTVRMGHYARILARGMGLDERMQDMVFHAAPLHDIGKIGISDTILLKPGQLTGVEFEMVKTHTTIGHDILKGSSSHYLEAASLIAVTHHEKYDGTGYPHGLAGEDIPAMGRLSAVADVFDVLTSKRPYKEPWSFEDAVQFIQESKGTHFDPGVVGIFMEKIEEVRTVYSPLSDTVF